MMKAEIDRPRTDIYSRERHKQLQLGIFDALQNYVYNITQTAPVIYFYTIHVTKQNKTILHCT
jgi:hypothetical protein